MSHTFSFTKIHLIFILFIGISLHPCLGQKQNTEPSESRSITEAKAFEPGSIEEIAAGINKTEFTAASKIKEIYTWVGKNIAYDPGQINNPDPYKSTEDLISQVLNKRKAICQGYSALFNGICKLCDIQSFIVHGYVKYNGIIDDIPHAWIAAKTDDSWLLYDPTWGAGYMERNDFVPRFSLDFFQITPEESIKSRMPFDPSWQLLKQPVTHKEFISGKKDETKSEEYNFNDSITTFLLADEQGRFAIESHRVHSAGLANKLISDYNNYLMNALTVFQHNKEVERNNDVINSSNEAVGHFNKAISAYNEYVNAKNKQFRKPNYTDNQVINSIETPHNELTKSELIIKNLQVDDPAMKKNILELSRNIAELRKSIDQERKFVDTYCQTTSSKRITLFRNPVKQVKSHK